MSTTFPIDVTTDRLVEFHGLADALCQLELGRLPGHTIADSVGEIIELMALNGQTGDQIQSWLHDQPEAIAHRALPPPVPPLPDLHVWRGAFCIPNALPGIPYGDGMRIWTPSYGVYNDEWRGRILDAYVLRGYTHFVYNIASPDGVYHNDYPALADDPGRARRDLTEIRARGLVAVVACCNDANGGTITPYASISANADLIPVCFPMWEMNGPLGVDTMVGGESVGRIGDCIRNTRAAAPASLLYVHFTAGHGAGAEPEGEWWQWFSRTQQGAGLLSQDDHWDDPANTSAGLSDTARHLHGQVGGWEGLNLDNVAFELQTTALYHYGRTEQQGLDFMTQVLSHTTGIAGFCDSGR